MSRPLRIWTAGRELAMAGLDSPLDAARRGRPVEIEIGFGKGRFLLSRAAARPDTTFVGIEAATLYWQAVNRQAERRGLGNLITVCGDALYVLAACLEREVASAMHVYFPDPWPKTRHHRRRLLDASTVDLVVGALAPGGALYFATDHAAYGDAVRAVLARYPAVSVTPVEGPWPDGPRTHYETKYEVEGRPILRLIVTRVAPAASPLLHPDGVADVVAGDLGAEDGAPGAEDGVGGR
jgi:tRNA (guanine-N7-)-methyltransferase